MQYLSSVNKRQSLSISLAIILSSFSIPTLAIADNSPIQQKNNLASSKQDSIDYLQKNPKEFETLLLLLLQEGNDKALSELLPVYKKYDQHDPSIIEWGKAINKVTKGNLKGAIKDYRKLNAKLPNNRIIAFQLARLLYNDAQYKSAKKQFERLRASAKNSQEKEVINDFITAINEQQDWRFNVNLSYLNDDNLTNAPKKGTKLVKDNGSETRFTGEHESGHGISLGLSANKKWLFDNHLFTSVDLDNNINYYWDNKKFNDVSSTVSLGGGYQNNKTEIKLSPFYNKYWYGGGTSSDASSKVESFNQSSGVKLNINQWLSPKLLYQGYAKYSDTNHEKDYNHNDFDSQLYANTLIYFPKLEQNAIVGLDYYKKNALSEANSFNRKGIRFGFGQNWDNGFSTNLNFNYAIKNYNAPDFFGIERKNKEYGVNADIWNKGYSFLGLTPHLNLSYSKVNSNSPFEETKKHNVYLELNKNF